MQDMESFYNVGNELCLKVQGLGKKRNQQILPDNTEIINAKILQIIQPVTQQVVLRVSYASRGSEDGMLSDHAVLKLYDHRFAAGMRTDNWQYSDIDAWSESINEDFLRIMTSHEAVSFSGQDNSLPADDWTPAQKEVFLYHQSIRSYQREKLAYEALAELQGRSVPTLYADIYVCPRKEIPHKFLRVPGLLMELIGDACSLRDLPQFVPEEEWQGICDGAIEMLRQIDQYEVINEDVRMDNVLVRIRPNFDRGSKADQSRYQCIFIDFGHAHVRNATTHNSDRDWTMWKCATDEEGALGLVVQNHLKKIEGTKKKKKVTYPFVYQPSRRYKIMEKSIYGPLGEFSTDH